MPRADRWKQLLDVVGSSGRVDIDDAAAMLGVSPATVRRDLDELAGQQLLVRTRGGAIAHSVSYDLPMRYRMSRHPNEKRAIAAAIAALVEPGMVVGLNGGTTTTEVARAVAERHDLADPASEGGGFSGPVLTIVTNAMNIAHELAVRRQFKLVLTGGVLRPQSYELVGPLASETIGRLRFDLVVLGVDGVSVEGGATTNNEVEAATNEMMALRAAAVVVAADASKLGREAFARICPIGKVQQVVTAHGAEPAIVDALRTAGVVVTVAAPL